MILRRVLVLLLAAMSAFMLAAYTPGVRDRHNHSRS